MIEQIIFNNNNPNLILVTSKDLNNSTIQKEFLQLVKLAFDYQKILSKDSCKTSIQI